MTEKPIQDSGKTLTENNGHRRISESVDMTKTPQQERDDPKRGQAGSPRRDDEMTVCKLVAQGKTGQVSPAA